MIGTILVSILKASAIILSGGIVYVGYWVYKVYKERKFYSQYKNVVMAESYSLILGDDYEENEIDVHINAITKHPDADIYIEHHFMKKWFNLYSPKAIKEFKKLYPKVIDRSDYETKLFGKLYPVALDKLKSTAEWKLRRQGVFKYGAMKNPDKHLYMLQDELLDVMRWKKGKKLNVSDLFNDLGIETLAIALFSTKFFDQIGKWKYQSAKGFTKNMDWLEAMDLISEDTDVNYENPLLHLWPYIFENSKESKRVDKNIKELHEKLLQFLKKRKITNLCEDSKVSDEAEEFKYVYDDEALVNDVINIIDAGSGTVDVAICSCLYRLKQHPDVYQKLMEELKESGIK